VTRPVPQGYVRLALAHADVVVHQKLVEPVTRAMEAGTLYAWAERHPERRQLQGRLPVYAAPLTADGPRVVVRHAHHGGMVAALLRDRFVPPTRAPAELFTSLVLTRAGVPTPPVAAYAIYPAGPVFKRSDVMTVELPGEDLGALLRSASVASERQRLIGPVAALLGALTQAGAWHPDLNVKNILLVPDDAFELHPAVLDIDRVRFISPGDPNLREANFRRLTRSLAKWRGLHGVGFTDDEIGDLHDRLERDEAVQAAHRALAMEAYMP
jgi:3-deoxy-D-manno-octulosonic acid kinase